VASSATTHVTDTEKKRISLSLRKKKNSFDFFQYYEFVH